MLKETSWHHTSQINTGNYKRRGGVGVGIGGAYDSSGGGGERDAAADDTSASASPRRRARWV